MNRWLRISGSSFNQILKKDYSKTTLRDIHYPFWATTKLSIQPNTIIKYQSILFVSVLPKSNVSEHFCNYCGKLIMRILFAILYFARNKNLGKLLIDIIRTSAAPRREAKASSPLLSGFLLLGGDPHILTTAELPETELDQLSNLVYLHTARVVEKMI